MIKEYYYIPFSELSREAINTFKENEGAVFYSLQNPIRFFVRLEDIRQTSGYSYITAENIFEADKYYQEYKRLNKIRQGKIDG